MASEVAYEGQDAFAAAANGDFPLVVLLWGMAMAAQPAPVDLLAARDRGGNSLLHHCAAGGVDAVDTLHFLLQQTQQSGRPALEIIDARNLAGETPLIRAASAGNLRIVDVLLHYGHAELLAKDADGNTAAHHAAARGQLWVLHFLLEEEQRRRIAASSPQEPVQPVTLGGRSARHWTALHYATDRGHKTVVQYLIARGFDPLERDIDGVTPVDLAMDKRKQKKELQWLEDLLKLRKSATDPPTSFRRTRPLVALAYASVLFGILSTSYWLPWWLSVPLIAVVLWKSLAAFRQPHGHGHSHGGGKKDLSAMHPSKRDVSITPNVSITPSSVASEDAKKKMKKKQSPLKALTKPRPEMAMGIWMAWVALFTLFYVALWADSDYTSLFNTRTDRAILIAVGAMELVFLVAWTRLAFICPSEPGTISTYATDVKNMLESAARAEPPDMAGKYCRTCFVAKPMRAKHCSQCGVCVARMDHHCAWINRCVGFGNHRLFVVFLLLHCLVLVDFAALAFVALVRIVKENHRESEGSSSLSAADVWMEIPGLVGDYFLVVMVLLWACCAFVALGMMFKQHVGNMVRNLTINEQINWRRYSYLLGAAKPSPGAKAPPASPVLSNPFDRGTWRNVQEFFSRSGTNAVDYHAVFRAPSAADAAASPNVLAEKKLQLQASSREIGADAMV